MTRRAPLPLLASLLLACGGGGEVGTSLLVGEDDASAGFVAGDGAAGEGLDAHIEEGRVAVTVVAVSCAGGCATVRAVGTGGHAPYAYRWDDGATEATRTLCPTADTSFAVTVSDSGEGGELPRPPQTARASVTADVLACSDAGSACTGAPQVAGLPASLAIDTTGPVRYFAGGASLPAGRYRVEYVDGCMQYGGDIQGVMSWGWTIHTGVLPINPALSLPTYGGHCVLVGASTSDVVGILPGTTNPPPGIATYAGCVAANRADAPLDFDFSGGKLGLFVEDTLAGDDVGGQASNGVSPTWKLTALGCP